MRAFISYSHRDDSYRVELDKHLALLKRQNLIHVWSDHCIRPGEALDPAIAKTLDAADLVLLLVSSDFMHSDYCYGVEMQRAMARHDAGTAMVVPIILRPCDWMSAPFGKLKALPTDGKAVTKWTTYDDAFYDVVHHLRNLLTAPERSAPRSRGELGYKHQQPSALSSAAGERLKPPRSSNLSLPRTFTDEDRHDFIVQCFEYLRKYFEESLTELKARNSGVSGRLTMVSPRAFTAIVFRDGKRQAGCHIRMGSGFGADSIAFSASEHAQENSYNELLSVESDKNLLFLKASMGIFTGNGESRLTEEGGAEHLWSMFIGGLRH